MTLLKVGKADAIVIQTSKENMVIDTGEEDGEELVMFLKKQGISRVDTLLITHYDQEHVGGADTLMESMETERVIIPDYEEVEAELREPEHEEPEYELPEPEDEEPEDDSEEEETEKKEVVNRSFL